MIFLYLLSHNSLQISNKLNSMIVKKIRGMIIVFPSEDVMNKVLKDAEIKPEEIEDVKNDKQ